MASWRGTTGWWSMATSYRRTPTQSFATLLAFPHSRPDIRMLVNFIGTASQYAGRVRALRSADFQIEGGLNVLPTKGDLLLLPVNGRAEPVRFKCTGRHFDFASDDGPVMDIDLELR